MKKILAGPKAKTIEIEKKFILNEGDEQRLVAKATFFDEKVFTDVYYDVGDYFLTTRGIWLRRRDQQFQLKVPVSHARGRDFHHLDRYYEIEQTAEICRFLDVPIQDLDQNLTNYGYFQVAIFTTNRRRYQRGEFLIALDRVDFGYTIAEIELRVDEPTEVDRAGRKIIDFAMAQGLKTDYVRAKLFEYLRRFCQAHYQILVEAGVIMTD